MRTIKIGGLIWDLWNVKHVARRNVAPAEVEAALRDGKRKILETYGERLVILGGSGKRLLAVVLAPKGGQKYYVVTARDMSKKERRFYHDEKKVKNSKI